jgi:hypothetical protein
MLLPLLFQIPRQSLSERRDGLQHGPNFGFCSRFVIPLSRPSLQCHDRTLKHRKQPVWIGFLANCIAHGLPPILGGALHSLSLARKLGRGRNDKWRRIAFEEAYAPHLRISLFHAKDKEKELTCLG